MLHELTPSIADLEHHRDRVLRTVEPLPAPPLQPAPVSDIEDAETALKDQIAEHGLGWIQFAEPLADADFAELGRRFGHLMVEDAPDVQPFVTDQVILNLRQSQLSGRVEEAPFEAKELLLHTEGSRRPAAQQPRFIVLYCVDAGSDHGSQTVLIPFADVLDRLDVATRELLQVTHDARADQTPHVLEPWGQGLAFSFRDLGDETYLWETPHSPDDAQAALDDILQTCYSTGEVYGSHWSPGMLMVIDNRRWFHGRTWSRPAEGSPVPRHLKRLRIQDVPA